MQPDVFQRETQKSITETTLLTGGEEFAAGGFKQLAVLNARRAHLLASATTQTAIDVALKRSRVAPEPALADRAHQIEPAARSIVFVTGDYVSWARFETQPAMNAGEQLVFFMRKPGY
jgi:hypothetical protein